MHSFERLFFKLFLITYGGFLLVHVGEMVLSSWQLLAGMLGGMAVALVAHKQHGYLPSVFLVGHILIEWYHHALHGSHYDGGEIAFHGVHAILDMAFLCVEAKEHYAKYALLFFSVVFLMLVGIVAYSYVPAPSEIEGALGRHHARDEGLLYHAVVGGILGCIIWHLFPSSKWKRVHQH